MLVYIVCAVVIVLCVVADRLINKKRIDNFNSKSCSMVKPFKKGGVRTPWSRKDLIFLANNYKELSIETINSQLETPRTKWSIYKKGGQLMKLGNPFNDKEHNELLTEKLRTESNNV